MRTAARVLTCCLALGATASCSSRGSGAGSASAPGSATPSAAATASPDGGKPPPPADAKTSCTVKFTGVVPPKGGPEYAVTNTGTHDLRFCQIEAYAYDAKSKQVAHKGLSYNSVLKPGATVKDDYFPLEDAAKTPGLAFEAVVTSVIFTDGSTWDDYSLGPAERPRGGRK
jgi:hypothetical protein